MLLSEVSLLQATGGQETCIEPVESLVQFTQALNLTLPPLDLTSTMIPSATGIRK
jgi:hypothetical protein